MVIVYPGSLAWIWQVWVPTMTPERSEHLGGAADTVATPDQLSVAAASTAVAAKTGVGMRI